MSLLGIGVVRLKGIFPKIIPTDPDVCKQQWPHVIDTAKPTFDPESNNIPQLVVSCVVLYSTFPCCLLVKMVRSRA